MNFVCTRKIAYIIYTCLDSYGFCIQRDDSILTDVVNGACTELAVKLLCPEASEVMDGEGPKVQNIVPGECVSLLDHHYFGTKKGQLYRSTQATGSSSDYQALQKLTAD